MSAKKSPSPGKPKVSPPVAPAVFEPEDGLRDLFGETPVPVLVLEGNGRLVFANRAATELLRSRPPLGEPFSLGASETWQVWFRRTVERGESFFDLPLVATDPTGFPIPLLVTLSPIRREPPPHGCLVLCREGRLDYQLRRTMQLQEAILNSILENFPTPFFLVEPDLRVTHINAAMAALTGFSREEVVGRMTCAELLRTEQCGTPECVLLKVMESQQPIAGWRRVVRDRGGKGIPVVVSASVITDQSGKVIGGFEAIRDITPIIEAEKKVELITELTPEGMLMVDEHLNLLFVNSKMAEILGRSREELLSLKLDQVMPSPQVKMALDLIDSAKQGRTEIRQFCTTLNVEAADTTKNRYFETCMAASRIGENILTCIYLRDLTYRMRMHEQLKQTNIFLHNILRCSVDGIVVIDAKGNPLIYNEGAERILGYKASEIIADRKGLHRFYPLELAREMMRRMKSPDYGGPDRLSPTEITFYNKDGEEVPVRFSAAIIRDKERILGSVGIFSDLREQRRMQKQLEESQAQLLQAEKIASLGRLAAGVAHEINNPLAGILIYAELLQRELGPEASGQEYLEEIIQQTMRCRQIVQRLLEFSRQSLGERSYFNLNAVITRCAEILGRQAMFHNVRIIRNLDPDLPEIMGDPGQLQQVLTNLFLNACDAMDGKGTITITTRADPEGDGVILTFQDTGCGIPPELREKIFEPFFTTKPVGAGTGLGLSIVYGVIQRHGGTIEVDSEVGVGTTFTIRLPRESQVEVMPFALN